MYHKVNLDLSNAQVKRLAAGEGIHVHHKKIGHGRVFHLTKTQVNKLKTRHAAGKGMRMSMSAKQIAHNIKNGEGFFDIIKDVGKAALGGLKTIGREYGPQIVEKLVDKYGPSNATAKTISKEVGKFLVKKASGGKISVGGSFRTFGRGTVSGKQKVYEHPHTGRLVGWHKPSKRWRHIDIIDGKGFWSEFADGFKKGFGTTARLFSSVAEHIPGVGKIAAPLLSGAASLVGHGVSGRGVRATVSRTVPQGI